MKMTPLNKEVHGALKIAPVADFRFVGKTHFASIVLPEFPQAASTFPIVFIQNPNTEQYEPVILLGVEPGQNLFVDEEGNWQASFLPASVRQYPFAYSVSPDNPEQWVLIFDEESSMLGDEAGDLLFDEKGEETEILQQIMTFIGELQGAAGVTDEFCRFLMEKDMIMPLGIQVPRGQEMHQVQGVFGINEKRLTELSDEEFLEFRNKGYLPLMYAHLFSIGQMERLAMLLHAGM